jgi:hypothetical protein
MPCAKIKVLELDGARASALIRQEFGTDTAFLAAYCICKQTYYRWIKGTSQPPLGFYALLSDLFGGTPQEFAKPKARK